MNILEHGLLHSNYNIASLKLLHSIFDFGLLRTPSRLILLPQKLVCQACFIIGSIYPTPLYILTVLHVLFHVFFKALSHAHILVHQEYLLCYFRSSLFWTPSASFPLHLPSIQHMFHQLSWPLALSPSHPLISSCLSQIVHLFDFFIVSVSLPSFVIYTGYYKQNKSFGLPSEAHHVILTSS